MIMEGVYKIPCLLFVLAISLVCFGVDASSTQNLTAVQACKCCTKETTISPYGAASSSSNGSPYSIRNMKQIIVGYSTTSVESITYVNKNGNSLKTGGGYSISVTLYTIILSKGEYLTGMTGTVGRRDNLDVITSIKFYTNIREYGSFGVQGYKPFSVRLQCAKVTGFHGSAGWRVDSIGLYFVFVCPETIKMPMVESI